MVLLLSASSLQIVQCGDIVQPFVGSGYIATPNYPDPPTNGNDVCTTSLVIEFKHGLQLHLLDRDIVSSVKIVICKNTIFIRDEESSTQSIGPGCKLYKYTDFEPYNTFNFYQSDITVSNSITANAARGIIFKYKGKYFFWNIFLNYFYYVLNIFSINVQLILYTVYWKPFWAYLYYNNVTILGFGFDKFLYRLRLSKTFTVEKW